MTHYIKSEIEKSYDVEMGCSYPNRKNNYGTCPNGFRDCHKCDYGTAKMKIKDFLKMCSEYNVTIKS